MSDLMIREVKELMNVHDLHPEDVTKERPEIDIRRARNKVWRGMKKRGATNRDIADFFEIPIQRISGALNRNKRKL